MLRVRSSPSARPAKNFRDKNYCEERFPSGQREQTVNLPAYAFGGSNPPLSTNLRWHRRSAGVAQLVEREPSKLGVAGSNPVSRSIPRASGVVGGRCR